MHLDPEKIQAFLDGQLSSGEMAGFQAHTAACARCKAEVEGWEFLFEELDELPLVEPTVGFIDEVMAALPEVAPAKNPVRRWLAARQPQPTPVSSTEHLPEVVLQEYLDQLMPAWQMAQVKDHLMGCSGCRIQLLEWREVMSAVETLPELGPSAEFADRVMSRVRIRATLPTPARSQGAAGSLLPRLKRLWPQSRHAWAAASGVAVPAVATLSVAAYLVLSHPLLSVGNLASYGWWKLSSGVVAVSTTISSALVESSLAFQAYSLLAGIARSPLALGGGALLFSATMVTATWVLYRNLHAAHQADHSYVRISA